MGIRQRTVVGCALVGLVVALAACSPQGMTQLEPAPPGCEPIDSCDIDSIESQAQKLVGLGEEMAVDAAAAAGYAVRITARDGEDFPQTMDYSPTRINLKVREGAVVEASVG